MSLIIDALSNLEEYCLKNNFRGYDPYDALKSPIFNIPLLRSNKRIRFGFQQIVKRLPFNIRPLLAVPKGYNPVTLGLLIQGYSYLAAYGRLKSTGSFDFGFLSSDSYNLYLQRIDLLIDELKSLIPPGYRGACWGYDFPWEARYASIPSYQPTIVATGIIINALYECYNITGNKTAKELCVSSADFVLHDLNRTYDEDTFCFSYSPFDKQRVFNANMKGARLLAEVYSLDKSSDIKTLSSQSVKYVLKNQNIDGSWFYSDSKKGKWIDNYHTGYILDCLDEYFKHTQDTSVSKAIDVGYNFYRVNFFENNGQPKFYHNKTWPLDCTAGAQSILSLCRFKDYDLARKVAEFMIINMQSPNGGFYYRKFKCFTHKTSFMRWSNAWMFAALAKLIFETAD